MASGDYDVAADAVTRRVSLADGSAVKLKLDSRRWLALTGNIEQQDNQHVIVSLQATGSGRHLIEVRAWNAEVGTFDRTIELKGSPVRWQLSVQISKVDMPWLLLVGPQGRPSERIQFSGRSPVAVPG
jgi:hypothetical protein